VCCVSKYHYYIDYRTDQQQLLHDCFYSIMLQFNTLDYIILYIHHTSTSDETVLFCSVLFCSVLFCSVLFCSVLFCSVLFCSVLFCSVLFCSVLFCSVLFCSVHRNSTTAVVSSWRFRLLLPGGKAFS
jgi:hypothetical protein